MKNTQPKLITHRSQIISVQHFVDDCLERISNSPENVIDFSKDEDRERFKKYLSDLFFHFTSTLSYDLSKAAEKGIAEALNLMRDPSYYETVKNRRQRERQRNAEQEEQRKTEAFMKKHYPTKEEIEREIKWNTQQLEYHEKHIIYARKRLDDLQAKKDVLLESFPDEETTGDDLIM